jgi:G3E family GTPase
MTSRYIMLGGFLGAGKTTLILKLADYLQQKGLRVGLITNDQGSGLVDTARARNAGFAVEEISGGCFCCRFSSLKEAAEKLNEATRPDVFLGEPVGSCTDLLSSVSYPLRRMYGDTFNISPLVVVLDPIRAEKVLGIHDGLTFSDKVAYIYKQQILEAGFIFINKMDLISPDRRNVIKREVLSMNPRARVFDGQANLALGVTALFDALLDSQETGTPLLTLDYQAYGEGEACLGWLNATVNYSSDDYRDGNEFLTQLCMNYAHEVSRKACNIAHLKMTLSPGGFMDDIASVSLVDNDTPPMLTSSLSSEFSSATLIVNMRAEADPALLRDALTKVITTVSNEMNCRMTLEHLEAFSPDAPAPTPERETTLREEMYVQR